MNKQLVGIVIAIAVVFLLMNKDNLFNKKDVSSQDNQHAAAAVGLGAGTLDNSSPDPGPNPNPSPDVKPDRKDCKVCMGTGWVKQGDGHVSKCVACKDPSSQVDVDKEVDTVISMINEAVDKAEAGTKAFYEQKIAEERNAQKVKEESIAEQSQDSLEGVDPEKLIEEACIAYKAKKYEDAGKLIEKACYENSNNVAKSGQNTDETKRIANRINSAINTLKKKGVDVTPVYVIEKEAYDKYVESNKKNAQYIAELKREIGEWKTYTTTLKQKPVMYFGGGSDGGSCGAGGCSGGSCSSGGGGCSSGSCGSGSGGSCGSGGGGCSSGSCGGGGGRGFF